MVIVLSSLGLTSCVPNGDIIKVDFGAQLGLKAPVEEKIPVAHYVHWPLTGLLAEDRVAVYNRPISVKIENSVFSRPQTNIHRADVIIESEIEGGETRFNCMFHSDVPDIVGNVRSARMSDLWLVPQFNALFFYSGANSDVLSRIRKSDIADMSDDGGGDLFFRSNDTYAPHNLYLEIGKVFGSAKKEGYAIIDTNIEPILFEPMNPDGTTGGAIADGSVEGAATESTEGSNIATTNNNSATDTSNGQSTNTSGAAVATDFAWTPANIIDVQFSGASTSNWAWDASNRVYLRGQNGEPHMERTTNTQLTAKNVVVMYAVYTQMSKKDPAGSPTFDTTLGGSGKAIIFRDGMQLECTWNADQTVKPYFTDANGTRIPLDPGNTWFQIIRDGESSAKVTIS